MCGTTEVTFQNDYCKYCACFEKRHPFLLLQLLLHRLLLITSTWRSNSTYSDLVKQPVDRNITWILGSTSSCIQLVVCWLPVFAISSADYHTSPCSMESWQASATTDLVQKKMAREARCCGRGMSTFRELLEVNVSSISKQKCNGHSTWLMVFILQTSTSFTVSLLSYMVSSCLSRLCQGDFFFLVADLHQA